MEKNKEKTETRVTQLASSTLRRAPMLGRKITRRLSLVTRVPSLLTNRNYQVTGSRESIRIRAPRPRKVRSFHVTVVLPDDSQRTDCRVDSHRVPCTM
ncbi:hypothetical protein FJT64_014128 [Amphibalanus amphitrite]|uniref:Uncharacterized protein n=1 Tax=Amphibalanus amphitrite TaxID=1232801 RepID=A0A6A4V788_AMPAM|nr:hypothetical protein FJT64_014128 [Amphibalanus amphitrite]